MWLRLCLVGGTLMVLCVDRASAAKPMDDAEDRAITQLEELGIRVMRDESDDVSYIAFPRGATGEQLRNANMYLTQLSPFKSLALSRTAIRDDDLFYLSNLDIQVLYLHETQISWKGMKHLRGLRDLRTLWLFQTNIDDRIFDDLLALPKLNYLHVYGTSVSDEAIARFTATRPKCCVLK